MTSVVPVRIASVIIRLDRMIQEKPDYRSLDGVDPLDLLCLPLKPIRLFFRLVAILSRRQPCEVKFAAGTH